MLRVLRVFNVKCVMRNEGRCLASLSISHDALRIQQPRRIGGADV